eukprot:4475312-Ditylum_brightwellii.AAC.1
MKNSTSNGTKKVVSNSTVEVSDKERDKASRDDKEIAAEPVFKDDNSSDIHCAELEIYEMEFASKEEDNEEHCL